MIADLSAHRQSIAFNVADRPISNRDTKRSIYEHSKEKDVESIYEDEAATIVESDFKHKQVRRSHFA